MKEIKNYGMEELNKAEMREINGGSIGDLVSLVARPLINIVNACLITALSFFKVI